MLTTDYSKLTKDQLLADLESAYKQAEPVNNQMVEIATKVQSLTAEVYRRGIKKALGLEPKTTKCVMSIGCNVHPNKGLPELARRLTAMAEGGIKITTVEFNETLNEFRFYTDPEATQPEPSTPSN